MIFEVYGDGQLLYQSPTLTYASGAVPIDVSVAGVTTLTLIVAPAPGTNSSADHAVWADARLVSTANFGSTQPYTMTWQLSQNGIVLSTQTTDSFVLGAISGAYTLTLTVTDAQGDTATASSNVVVTPATASASYLKLDSHTEGQWIGTYGTEGYDVIGGPSSLPSYAVVTPSGQATYTWAASTDDPRALQVDPGTFGVAASWYSSTSFAVDVNLTDGQSHALTLYAVDFSNQGRSEEIQIVSAATGAVLDSRTISSFTAGVYLQWIVTGNIEIEVTKLAGPNAVLSGLFFDPPTTAVIPMNELDGTTEGNWIGTYGTQGYEVIGNATSLPGYATITPSGTLTYVWPSTTAVQALQDASGTGRTAACWYSSTSFTVAVNLTDDQSHDLALYALDFDNMGRSEEIQLLSASTGAVLDTETISSFSDGVYLQWTVTGSVVIKVTKLAGPNAVLSGIFIEPPPASTSATFLNEDTTTQGNWIGAYGTQGYDVIANATSLPGNATITPSGASTYVWPSTTAVQALQDASDTGRTAACWYSSTSFTVAVNLTDGQSHDLALYALDFDNKGRSEEIQILSASTGAVLDTETISSFSGGVYLQWMVTGSVVIKVIKLDGPNAVVSGIFIDAPSTSTSATFLNEDTTTQGNWIGAYGTQGYDVIANATSLPGYATITPSGASTYVWPSTTVVQALQDASGTGRTAACWYSSTSFTVAVNLTDGQSHDLALYALDFDNKGRSEEIQILSASTGAVLDTETISSFSGGVYLQWMVTGSVVINVIKLAGPNALISGVFIDPAS